MMMKNLILITLTSVLLVACSKERPPTNAQITESLHCFFAANSVLSLMAEARVITEHNTTHMDIKRSRLSGSEPKVNYKSSDLDNYGGSTIVDGMRERAWNTLNWFHAKTYSNISEISDNLIVGEMTEHMSPNTGHNSDLMNNLNECAETWAYEEHGMGLNL